MSRHRPGPAVVLASRVLLVPALLAVAFLTLLPAGARGGVNLVPGAGIALQLDNPNRAVAFVNLVGNVALFVPLGLLAVPALGWTWPRVVLAGAAASTAIEVAQYRLGRASDVDDVLLNTAGTLAGALVAATLVAAGAAVRAARRRRQNVQRVAPPGSVVARAVADRGVSR